MALLFVDGFDHYTGIPGSANAKWNTSWIPSRLSISSSYARFSSGGGLQMNDNLGGIGRLGFGQLGTWYFGFAYYRQAIGTWAEVLWTLTDTSYSNRQIFAKLSGGTLMFSRGAWDTAPVYQCNCTTVAGVWYYFEFKVIVHSSTGRVIVKQDGVQIGDSGAGGINTSYSGNPYAEQFMLGYNQTGYTDTNRWYDDLWIDDAQFHGDCRVLTKFPSGAGNYTQWDPSAGSNFQCVDEAAPDTNDYVSTGVLDELDTYAIGDISQNAGTVKAVVGNYLCQKTEAGSRQIGMATRLGSDQISTGKAIASSWAFLQFIQETKPGGGAWSVQDTKDAEMGMKLTA